MARRNIQGKDLYMLPIPAKEILIDKAFRKLTEREFAFWVMCCCYALLHENKITLEELKDYHFPMFPDVDAYDELFEGIKHLFDEPDGNGIFMSTEVAWASQKAHERSEIATHANKVRWAKE